MVPGSLATGGLQQILHKYLSSKARRWLNKRNWGVLDWRALSVPYAAQRHVAETRVCRVWRTVPALNLGNGVHDALVVNSFFFHLSNDSVYFQVIFIDSKSRLP